MIKISKPCPSCGNRRFGISDGNAECLDCGKIWELSDELNDEFGEEK